MTNTVTITVCHAKDRGKLFAAVLTGTHETYGFKREFLNLVEAEHVSNCYYNYRAVEAASEGQIVETMSANYKGKPTRAYYIVKDGALVEISKHEAAVAVTALSAVAA